VSTHPIVTAEVELFAARARLHLEQLRTKRASLSTATGRSHHAALSLAKRITEAEKVCGAWLAITGVIESMENTPAALPDPSEGPGRADA
jgi:hypothetical protein